MNNYIDRNGYFRDRNTNELVHRKIAEKSIGRRLKLWEVVHHINGNKLDNDPTNLEVLHYKEHTLLHRFQKETSGAW